MPDLAEQTLDTWRVHHRIHLYLLDAIAPDALAGVSASKGRSVGEQFAHIHAVRLMWLKVAAPDLVDGMPAFDKADAQDGGKLRGALEASGLAIEALLERSLHADGKIKGFKPHVVAFMGYLIAHESSHRGEIGVILTQSGHPLDKKVSYGLWEWGVR